MGTDWGAQCYEHALGLSGLWDPSKFQDVGKFQIRFVGRAGAGGEREYPGRPGQRTQRRGKEGGGAAALGREQRRKSVCMRKGSGVGLSCLLINQAGNRGSWELPGLWHPQETEEWELVVGRITLTWCCAQRSKGSRAKD